jgi:preprotein translocase subunit SecF
VQLTTLLAETLKSGKITISQNDKPAVEVNVSEKKINADVIDKEFVKEIISTARKSSTKKGIGQSIRQGVDTLKEARKAKPTVKEIVEDLCREGVTITLSYKGDRVVTVGAEADSKLTRLVTGTKGVEINSPLKLAEMGI